MVRVWAFGLREDAEPSGVGVAGRSLVERVFVVHATSRARAVMLAMAVLGVQAEHIVNMRETSHGEGAKLVANITSGPLTKARPKA